jgi:peptide/nickel transport system substrate-binding protein
METETVSHHVGITRRALLARSVTLGAGALWLLACDGIGRQPSSTGQAPQTPVSNQATAAPARGGTLHISQPSDIVPSLAPFSSNLVNGPLYNLVYDTLVRYDTQLNVQPSLATSWEWSTDLLQLTLKLRPGVKFHTGRPFTSADAKFNLERLRDPAVGSQWLNYASEMQMDAPDSGTLVLSYTSPSRSSFDALTDVFLADPDTLDQTVSGKAFVGTGPFRFKEWVPGDHFTVVRNPDYWQAAKPYLDEVDVTIARDPQSALVNLESGGVDWVIGIAGQDAQRLKSDPGYQLILNGNGANFYYLGLDTAMPALSDKRVRQAFAYAVDRQRMVDAALYGFGRPASILWPRQSLAYDTALDASGTYDLKKARDLLAAASWAPSTTLPLLVDSSPGRAMAEILQQDLASIGVNAAVQKLDVAEFIPKAQKGQFGGAWIAPVGFMNLSPATLYMSALPVRVPNASHFESPRYKELIDQSRSESDDQKLKAIMRELTQITLDEAFVVPIAEAASLGLGLEAARSSVKNVTWDDWGWSRYQDIWLAR